MQVLWKENYFSSLTNLGFTYGLLNLLHTSQLKLPLVCKTKLNYLRYLILSEPQLFVFQLL